MALVINKHNVMYRLARRCSSDGDHIFLRATNQGTSFAWIQFCTLPSLSKFWNSLLNDRTLLLVGGNGGVRAVDIKVEPEPPNETRERFRATPCP
ncbi:hypothetical protein N7536_010703 [Penicillium majusculum]|nr:hypothetical protein N7536_010703 [Penicillium majusculum]